MKCSCGLLRLHACMVTGPLSNAAGQRRLNCAGISSSMAGTVSGTSALFSMMARHSVPRVIPNAGLIPLRKAGLFYPAPVMPNAQPWQWKQWISASFDGIIDWVQLLDPPFDKSNLNPGYIKGYVPGVRENGGQYTHAAIWAAMAFAKLGDSRRAWELLEIINPVSHGRSPEEIETYKVEPYVVAADVYAVSPHIGAVDGHGTRIVQLDVSAYRGITPGAEA